MPFQPQRLVISLQFVARQAKNRLRGPIHVYSSLLRLSLIRKSANPRHCAACTRHVQIEALAGETDQVRVRDVDRGAQRVAHPGVGHEPLNGSLRALDDVVGGEEELEELQAAISAGCIPDSSRAKMSKSSAA